MRHSTTYVNLLADLLLREDEVGPDPRPNVTNEAETNSELKDTSNDHENIGSINGTSNNSTNT